MKVLLGVGGNDESFDALEEAIARAREAGDDLTVAVFERDEVDRTPAEIEARIRERLEEAGVEAEIHHIEGHPGSSLTELADSGGFDRLMLAGGKRSPLGKIQLGETLEFVLLNSETTVTLVR